MLWKLLDPRQGWIAFTFFSHKLLRWLCPFFLIGLLAEQCAALGHVLFPLGAGCPACLLRPRRCWRLWRRNGCGCPGPIRLMTMFTSMNAALLVGFVRWLGKRQQRRLAADDADGGSQRSPPMTTGYLLAGNACRRCSVLAACGMAAVEARRRGLDRWLFTYIRERSKCQAPRPGQPVHLLLCIADHFEPGNGGVTPAVARGRVRAWVEDYPRLCQEFRDSDGRPPRHTFFYPIEMYDEAEVDALARLCRLGLGEVEIHLHHDVDTSGEPPADACSPSRSCWPEGMGCSPGIARPAHSPTASCTGTGLSTTRSPDGRSCGVNNELEILRETGCYADFTLPSAPSQTQTRKINSIYYASTIRVDPSRMTGGLTLPAGAVPPRRADDDPGAAGPELAATQVGDSPSHRERLPSGQSAAGPGSSRRLAWREDPGSHRGQTGTSSSSTRTGPQRGTSACSWASRWGSSIGAGPKGQGRSQLSIFTT